MPRGSPVGRTDWYVAEQLRKANGGRAYAPVVAVSALSHWATGIQDSATSLLPYCIMSAWGLSTAEAATIVAVQYPGRAIGSLFMGKLCDTCGRRPAALITHGAMALLGFLLAAAPTLWMLIVVVFLLGASMAGYLVPIVLVSELKGGKTGGGDLMLLQAAYSLGGLTAVNTAWLLLDSQAWRIFALACAVPSLLSFLSCAALPESPRWLFSRGRAKSANDLFLSMIAADGGGDPGGEEEGRDDIPIPKPPGGSHGDRDDSDIKGSPPEGDRYSRLTDTEGHEAPEDPSLPGPEPLSDGSPPGGSPPAGSSVMAEVREVLAPGARLFALLASALWLLRGWAMSGVVVAVFRIFDEGGGGGGDGDDDTETCSYSYGLVVIVVGLASIMDVVVSWFIDHLGRAVSTILLFCTAAAALAGVSYIEFTSAAWAGEALIAALATIARAAVGAGASVTEILVVEIFPPQVRGTGSAICNFVSQAGYALGAYTVISTLSLWAVTSFLASVCAFTAAITVPLLAYERAGTNILGQGHGQGQGWGGDHDGPGTRQWRRNQAGDHDGTASAAPVPPPPPAGGIELEQFKHVDSTSSSS